MKYHLPKGPNTSAKRTIMDLPYTGLVQHWLICVQNWLECNGRRHALPATVPLQLAQEGDTTDSLLLPALNPAGADKVQAVQNRYGRMCLWRQPTQQGKQNAWNHSCL